MFSAPHAPHADHKNSCFLRRQDADSVHMGLLGLGSFNPFNPQVGGGSLIPQRRKEVLSRRSSWISDYDGAFAQRAFQAMRSQTVAGSRTPQTEDA